MLASVRRGEDGQSLIEFALCLPPLLLLMTGIFAFGIAIQNYMILTNAVSTAAMDLSISRGNTTDPCALASNAVIAAAPTLKSANFTYSYTLNGAAYTGTSCSSGSPTTGAAGNLVQGQSATVIVTYPCNLAVYKASNFPNCVLTAKTTELIQ